MIVPQGLLSEPLARLRVSIIESPAFQAWVGSTDLDIVAQQVHLLQTARNPTLPLCLIDYADGFERSRLSLTSGRSFEQRGALVLYLRDAVDPEQDETEAIYAFANRVGAVWADLERTAALPHRLPITVIGLALPPTRVESDRRPHAGDHFEAALAITWSATR